MYLVVLSVTFSPLIFSFDILTTIVKNKITSIVSQNCTNLDGIAPGTGLGLPKRSFDFQKRAAKREHRRALKAKKSV